MRGQLMRLLANSLMPLEFHIPFAKQIPVAVCRGLPADQPVVEARIKTEMRCGNT
ncbi:MAG: hypothetical protein OEV52_08470 [Dehalococcoidia bacterium]|nr:hypothetical protein [Dehalococcoidia bacterium]